VSPPLPVELNRDRRHEIRVAERYEADGPFSVDLRNHGDGVHVHVNVDGDLAEVARVAETNHYVDGDDSAAVGVDVDPVDDPVTGTLRLATGYGNRETTVEVTVTPFDGPDRVPVGEDLATPKGARAGDGSEGAPVVERTVEPEASGFPVRVFAVALGAVLLAVAVAVVVGGRVVTVGAGVVVAAALVAVVVSLR
jgi:hypothetical protein